MELDIGHWDQAADSAALVLRDPRSAQLARPGLVTLGLVRARRGDADALARCKKRTQWSSRRAGPDRQVAAARAEASWLSGSPDRETAN